MSCFHERATQACKINIFPSLMRSLRRLLRARSLTAASPPKGSSWSPPERCHFEKNGVFLFRQNNWHSLRSNVFFFCAQSLLEAHETFRVKRALFLRWVCVCPCPLLHRNSCMAVFALQPSREYPENRLCCNASKFLFAGKWKKSSRIMDSWGYRTRLLYLPLVCCRTNISGWSWKQGASSRFFQSVNSLFSRAIQSCCEETVLIGTLLLLKNLNFLILGILNKRTLPKCAKTLHLVLR